jgi:hypothetical protein
VSVGKISYYVEGYSNTFAVPKLSMNRQDAKQFVSNSVAESWARRYVSAWEYEIIPM